jgi:hypothetical protein
LLIFDVLIFWVDRAQTKVLVLYIWRKVQLHRSVGATILCALIFKPVHGSSKAISSKPDTDNRDDKAQRSKQQQQQANSAGYTVRRSIDT